MDGRLGNIQPYDPKQAELNAAIATNPKDVAARLARARFFLDRGERKAKGEPGNNRGGLLNLIEIRSPLPHSFEEAALHDLTVALTNAEDNPVLFAQRARAALVFNTKAPATLRRPQGPIEDDIEWAMLRVRREAEALLLLGEILRVRKGGERLALGFLSRAALVAPEQPTHSRDELLKALPSSTPSSPPTGTPQTALEWKDRGNAFNVGGDWRSALECYDKAIALAPTFADAYNNRGNVLSELGCYDLSVVALDKAIGLDPKHRIAYFQRGSIWSVVGDLDKAHADLTKAIEYAQSPSIKASAYTARAQVALKRFQSQVALVDALEATKLDPSNPAGWRMLGTAQLYLGNAKEAAESFKKVERSALAPLLRCVALAHAGRGSEKSEWESATKKLSPHGFKSLILFIVDWANSPLKPTKDTAHWPGVRDVFDLALKGRDHP